MIIEELVLSNQINYIDAICHYCDKHGMEIETASKLINKKIKASIEAEANDLNLFNQKYNKLPI